MRILRCKPMYCNKKQSGQKRALDAFLPAEKQNEFSSMRNAEAAQAMRLNHWAPRESLLEANGRAG